MLFTSGKQYSLQVSEVLQPGCQGCSQTRTFRDIPANAFLLAVYLSPIRAPYVIFNVLQLEERFCDSAGNVWVTAMAMRCRVTSCSHRPAWFVPPSPALLLR